MPTNPRAARTFASREALETFLSDLGVPEGIRKCSIREADSRGSGSIPRLQVSLDCVFYASLVPVTWRDWFVDSTGFASQVPGDRPKVSRKRSSEVPGQI